MSVKRVVWQGTKLHNSMMARSNVRRHKFGEIHDAHACDRHVRLWPTTAMAKMNFRSAGVLEGSCIVSLDSVPDVRYLRPAKTTCISSCCDVTDIKTSDQKEVNTKQTEPPPCEPTHSARLDGKKCLSATTGGDRRHKAPCSDEAVHRLRDRSGSKWPS